MGIFQKLVQYVYKNVIMLCLQHNSGSNNMPHIYGPPFTHFWIVQQDMYAKFLYPKSLSLAHSSMAVVIWVTCYMWTWTNLHGGYENDVSSSTFPQCGRLFSKPLEQPTVYRQNQSIARVQCLVICVHDTQCYCWCTAPNFHGPPYESCGSEK